MTSFFNSFYSYFKCSLLLLCVCALTFMVPGHANTNDFGIFSMNKELKPLSKSKARMLYRGKAKSLQGLRVELADWPSGSRIREQFYWSLLKRNSQQMNAYWASLTFSGKARQPVEFQQEDIQQLVAWLKKHPNRLAYARVNDIPSGANIIYVVKENE